MRRPFPILVLLVWAASAAGEDVPAIVDIGSRSDLAAPPRVAAAPSGTIIVLPMADEMAIVTRSGPGAPFGNPVRVAQRSDLVLGGRRGPRVAAAGDVVVVAAITKRTKKEGGDLLAWRSTDRGATFGEPARVSDRPGCAEEGLFDLAALGDGRFVVVWLDDRDKGMRVRADFSTDGAKWGEDLLAYASPDKTVCECCHPAVTATPDGGAILAFRNAIEGDRDVWTARLPRGATRFGAATKSGRGSWKIAACPMAGPSVDVSGNEAVSVWRREKDVFLVVGDAEERDLGEGTEPQVLVRSDGVHAFWIAGDALLHLAPGASSPVEIARGASLPCAAAGCVAWLDTKSRRARLLVLP